MEPPPKLRVRNDLNTILTKVKKDITSSENIKMIENDIRMY